MGDFNIRIASLPSTITVGRIGRYSAPRAWGAFAAKVIRIYRIVIGIALVASASSSLQQSAGPYCVSRPFAPRR
jgi:hypothetical protein